jgi:hypothetical protein
MVVKTPCLFTPFQFCNQPEHYPSLCTSMCYILESTVHCCMVIFYSRKFLCITYKNRLIVILDRLCHNNIVPLPTRHSSYTTVLLHCNLFDLLRMLSYCTMVLSLILRPSVAHLLKWIAHKLQGGRRVQSSLQPTECGSRLLPYILRWTYVFLVLYANKIANSA